MALTFRQKVLGLTRILFGWIFLWAFLDKVWGLGFATKAGAGWLDGQSPTRGFLQFGTEGPLAGWYQGLAGNPVVDWLFMAGLLGIGVAMVLGIVMRLAAVSGVILMTLLYMSLMPPENNPVVDEHVIYALVFIVCALEPTGDWWGLGRWWASRPWVQNRPWLK